MASRLRWRLQRLQAMRETAARLMARERLGRDVFARGAPEPVNVVRLPAHTDSLYDLLSAYATRRLKRAGARSYRPAHAPVLLIEEARERLERMLGSIENWNGLTRLLPPEWSGGPRRRSGLASTLLACLELARDGKLEMRQLKPFDEIYVRDRAAPRSEEAVS
jgi:segregation and condensation protein A